MGENDDINVACFQSIFIVFKLGEWLSLMSQIHNAWLRWYWFMFKIGNWNRKKLLIILMINTLNNDRYGCFINM